MPNPISSIINRFTGSRSNSPTRTIGTTAVEIHDGRLETNERSPALRGTKKFETYSAVLANCDIVAASVRYFLNLVAGAQWSVQPADEKNAKAKEIAEKVEAIIYDMATPWHRVVRKAALYKFLGFSIMEWTAKRREDGTIGLLDIENRPQHTIERWDLDESGNVLGVEQKPPLGTEVYLPRQKIVYLVDDALTDYPDGTGLLRHVVKAYQRLAGYEALEELGFETDLRGVPVARMPLSELQDKVKSGKITQADFDAEVRTLKKFVADRFRGKNTGLLLNSDIYRGEDDKGTPSQTYKYGVDLLKGEGAPLDKLAAAITRVTESIARVLGTEHLLLGTGGAGSLALSKSKIMAFFLAVEGCLKEIAETFEADILLPLARLNGWDPELLPTLSTDAVKFRDVEEIFNGLERLAQAGIMLEPDDDAVGELFGIIGLTRPERDMEDGAALRTDPEPTDPEEIPVEEDDA